MIDKLIDLCSKTRPACQFAESLSTQENFWDEFDLGGSTLTINTAKDGWGNLFDVEWVLRFIPENLFDNYVIYQQLRKISDDRTDREEEYAAVAELSGQYFRKYNTMLNHYLQNEYKTVPCYMFVYSSLNRPPRVYNTRPKIIFDFLESEYKKSLSYKKEK